eukprot:SAG22_NODE_2353_length_2674_cov_1.846990_1_plen_227_part_10
MVTRVAQFCDCRSRLTEPAAVLPALCLGTHRAQLWRIRAVSTSLCGWVGEFSGGHRAPVVLAIGGCDEAVENGWSDSDLSAVEALSLGPPLWPRRGAAGSRACAPGLAWRPLPGMPSPRGNPAACVLPDGSTLVIGGEKGHRELASVLVLPARRRQLPAGLQNGTMAAEEEHDGADDAPSMAWDESALPALLVPRGMSKAVFAMQPEPAVWVLGGSTSAGLGQTCRE